KFSVPGSQFSVTTATWLFLRTENWELRTLVTEVYDLLVLRSSAHPRYIHYIGSSATFLPCGVNAENWECVEWLLRGIPRFRLPLTASVERARSRRRFCSPACCAPRRRSAI